MQVQIIESNRGGKIALHDGHSCNQKQSTNNCIHWRCTKYYKLKCPAILKTKNETVIETKVTHNHECDPGECKAKEIVIQIKRRAEYSTPTVAIANEIYEISDDYAVQLAMPKKDNLLGAVSRKRQKVKWRNEPQPRQNTGRLRKGSAECFQQKVPPRRNLVLLFPPDAIFQPENQWDRIENSLRKISRIQLGTSNVTCSGTCSARPCKSIFWACYWRSRRGGSPDNK